MCSETIFPTGSQVHWVKMGDSNLTWTTANQGHPECGSSTLESPEEVESMGPSLFSLCDELNGTPPKLHMDPHVFKEVING